MAAHTDCEALCRSTFCELVAFCLFVSSLFSKHSLVCIFYSRRELLNIGSYNSDNFMGELPEIAKTVGRASFALSGITTGSIENVKKTWGAGKAMRAKS